MLKVAPAPEALKYSYKYTLGAAASTNLIAINVSLMVVVLTTEALIGTPTVVLGLLMSLFQVIDGSKGACIVQLNWSVVEKPWLVVPH